MRAPCTIRASSLALLSLISSTVPSLCSPRMPLSVIRAGGGEGGRGSQAAAGRQAHHPSYSPAPSGTAAWPMRSPHPCFNLVPSVVFNGRMRKLRGGEGAARCSMSSKAASAGPGSGGEEGKVTELVARSLDDTWGVAETIAEECRAGDLILRELLPHLPPLPFSPPYQPTCTPPDQGPYPLQCAYLHACMHVVCIA